jgi:DNA-directed RNA polymerase specialized sigma24 family protein
VANLGGWLTTVISRICLHMLRARSARREEPLGEHLPDPVVSSLNAAGPEQEAELAGLRGGGSQREAARLAEGEV